MAGKGQKVATDILYIQRGVAGTLRGIDQGHSAVFLCRLTDLFDRIDAAQGVRNMGKRDYTHITLLTKLLELVPLNLSSIALDREKPEDRPSLPRHYLPRNQVSVVLHFGEHDQITAAQVLICPACSDQVDSFGGTPRKNDRFRLLCIQVTGNPGACLLV
jgi:hypothetical protein